jgi:hypothetical protein
MNLTLVTTILITAAATSAGTYYLTTQTQPTADTPVETAAIQPQPPAQPAPVVVANAQPDKPIEITVKTEVVERHRPIRQHDFIAEGKLARSRPQPHFGIYQGK